jgi:DNA-binding NarL/FixJ family response regulator
MEPLRRTVAICENQPITGEGLKRLLETSGDLEFCDMVDSLDLVPGLVRRSLPDLLLIDKGMGPCSILDWLSDLKTLPNMPAVVVWGVSITEADALSLLLAGARGVIQKTAKAHLILSCLRMVSAGGHWIEDSVNPNLLRSNGSARSKLTGREQQVFVLVQKSLRIKAIATELGIRPGTVKIHLKHIYAKTGIHDINSLG